MVYPLFAAIPDVMRTVWLRSYRPVQRGLPYRPVQLPYRPVQCGLPYRPVQRGLPYRPVQRGLPYRPVQRGLPYRPVQRGLPYRPVQRGLTYRPVQNVPFHLLSRPEHPSLGLPLDRLTLFRSGPCSKAQSRLLSRSMPSFCDFSPPHMSLSCLIPFPPRTLSYPQYDIPPLFLLRAPPALSFRLALALVPALMHTAVTRNVSHQCHNTCDAHVPHFSSFSLSLFSRISLSPSGP
jgi:hypothetical protein